MSKIQFRGHCQCCGRIHAVLATSGHVAKHGYTIDKDFNYFHGTCPGWKYPPIEKERSAADLNIERVREHGRMQLLAAADFRNGKIQPLLVITNRWDTRTRGRVTIPYESATAAEQAKQVLSNTLACESQAIAAFSWATDMERLVNVHHGQPLLEVEADAGPAPIQVGERRDSPRGILTALHVAQGKVQWKDEKGHQSWMGVQRWRNLDQV